MILGSYTANRASTGGTITVSNGTTLKIGGTNGFPSNYSSTSLGSTSTVEYSGSAQSVPLKSYGHLALSGSGTKTIANGMTTVGNLTTSGTATASCSGSLTVAGNVAVGSGTSFSGGSGTIDIEGSLTAAGTSFTSTSGSLYVAGDFSVTAGSFTHNSGTIVLDGANAWITAAGATLNNLTVNKATYRTAVSLGASLSVAGTVTITQGYLILGSTYSLTAGTISISAYGRLKNYGTGTLTLGGSVTNNGLIDFNGGGDDSCGSATEAQIRSTVNGTQRSWSGSGVFNLVDVDVKDQGGSASITVYHGTNTGGNGANWSFSGSCVGAPTAVDLVSLTATGRGSGVSVVWQTAQEAGNKGFNLFRAESVGGSVCEAKR